MKKSARTAIFLCSMFLCAAAAHASVDSGILGNAIAASRNALLELDTKDGYYRSAPESNTLYTSLQILLYYYLNRQDRVQDELNGLRQYLLNTQSSNGSWLFYDNGSPDLGLTVLNYFALKLSGSAMQDPALQRAANYIRTHGGAGGINEMYNFLLSLFGLFPVPSLPRIWPQAFIGVAPQLSWLRIMIIPLLVVLQENAVYQPPEGARIDELFLNKTSVPRNSSGSEIIRLVRRAAHEPEGIPVSDTAAAFKSGCRLFLHWLLSRQNTTDGLFYDYMPTTFFALLSLKALDDRFDSSPAIDKALQGLRAMQIHRPEGIYQPPADDTIPATCSVVLALLTTGFSLEDPPVREGVDFLWSRQQTRFGDWFYQLSFPVLPGGWGFTFNSESFPDTDDTAGVVLTLQTAYSRSWETRWGDFTRALQWLFAMQNWDGGWGTWDRSSLFTKPMKKVVPPVVLNESVVDHTTRVLNALSRFGYTASNSPGIARAVSWLQSKQLQDGSWEGTWFVDYVYQTANVLGALALVKSAVPASSVEKSLNYILEKQNADGGWGESPDSFSSQKYVPLGHSSPTQTALVLFGLLNFLKGGDFQYIDTLRAPVVHAIAYLLTTQGADGRWNDPTYAAVVFPQIQYARYPIFQEAITLTVLGMYSQDADLFLE